MAINIYRLKRFIKLLRRKHDDEKARSGYPEALWPLLTLGKPKQKMDYGPWGQRLADYVPDLIRMALDDDLHQHHGDDPAVWSPLHALNILGVLCATEAAEPLLTCLDWDDDWFAGALPKVYGQIGPGAIPLLEAYLDDPSRDLLARAKAAKSLASIASDHASARGAIVEHLTAFLDRPTADDSPDEEVATTFVITELARLNARSAYPAIERAYNENRVDAKIIGLEDVEIHFGMRPPRDFSVLSAPSEESGVRLELRCKACGRGRSYLFPKVYCDVGTIHDEKKRAKYGSIIIPQRVVCQKCGAVDQYEISAMGHMALIADLLMEVEAGLQKFRREDQRVQYMEFEAMGRKMHPLEAIERYQAEIERHPKDSMLHVGYANVLKFLGRYDEAEAVYQRITGFDPNNPHAYVGLAELAREGGDKRRVLTLWQRVLEVTPHSSLSRTDKELFLRVAQDNLDALRTGRQLDSTVELLTFQPKPHRRASSEPSTPTWRRPGKEPAQPKQRRRTRKSAAQAPSQHTARTRQVRRNDPCPCGSGKKYKHCHGRKKRR